MTGYYRIVIDKIENASPSDGFIDNISVLKYRDDLGGGNPTTLELSLAKSRANIRYTQLILDLSETTNFNVLEIDRPDADVNTAPTTFEMTVSYDRVDYLFAVDGNGTKLSGSDAIKFWIAKSLISDFKTLAVVWNPELNDLNLPKGETVMNVEVGKLGNTVNDILPSISVTPLPLTSTL